MQGSPPVPVEGAQQVRGGDSRRDTDLHDVSRPGQPDERVQFERTVDLDLRRPTLPPVLGGDRAEEDLLPSALPDGA
jgi:hypothetical protein